MPDMRSPDTPPRAGRLSHPAHGRARTRVRGRDRQAAGGHRTGATASPKAVRPAVHRMVERERVAVEELPRQTEVVLQPAATVERVTDHGMLDVGGVNTYLVRAAGLQLALDERVAVVGGAGLEALEHLERGDGLPRAGRVADPHLLAVLRVPSDGSIDEPGVRHDATVDERDVAAIDEPLLDAGRQSALGVVVLVEPVHDARALVARERSEVVAVRKKRVDERPAPVAVGGMHHHPGGLGEHDHVVVLEADVERHVFRDEVRRRHRGELDREPVARTDLVALGLDLAVHPHAVALDELLRERAASDKVDLGQQDVEARAGLIAADGVREQAALSHRHGSERLGV
jgi:hypothetical protein